MVGVTLAMRRRHTGVLTFWLNGLRKGDEHPLPAYLPVEYDTLPLLITELPNCGTLLMNSNVCMFQVIIPRLLYEYTSSFVLTEEAGRKNRCETVMSVISQLMPGWQSLIHQLSDG